MPRRKKIESFKFSIIAGSLKGKVITAPDLGVTRPPLSRLRKSIFDFLNPYIKNALYLDLFSGTGSYLFEAASRGAANALGVELEEKLAQNINNQAKKLSVSDKIYCYHDSVYDMIVKLHKQGKKFDVIMMAPPQYKDMIDETLTVLKENPIVNEDGIIVCQHDTSERKIDFNGFEIQQKRKYGNTTFTVLKS